MDHLFAIPTGLGAVLPDGIVCQDCGCEMNAHREDYIALSKVDSAAGTLDRLISETHPGVRAKRAGELARIARLRSSDADPGARMENIIGLLLRASPVVDQRIMQVRLDRWSGLALLGVVVPIAVGIAGSNGILGPTLKWGAEALMYIAAVCFAITIVLLVTDVPRFMRRVVYPRLARILAPTNPTLDELECAAEALKKSRSSIGRRLNVRVLWRYVCTKRANRSES